MQIKIYNLVSRGTFKFFLFYHVAIIVFVTIIVARVWRHGDHSPESGSLGMMWVKMIGNYCPLSIEKKKEMRVVI